jgi:hypothetical protein
VFTCQAVRDLGIEDVLSDAATGRMLGRAGQVDAERLNKRSDAPGPASSARPRARSPNLRRRFRQSLERGGRLAVRLGDDLHSRRMRGLQASARRAPKSSVVEQAMCASLGLIRRRSHRS